MADQSLGRAVLDLVTDPTQLRRGMASARTEVTTALASTQAAASAALLKTGASMRQTGQAMTLGVTVPVLAAGRAIVGTGVDFDRTLKQIVGLAGVSADAIGGIKDGVLELAGETGRVPQELAEAFYFVASAGFEAEEAMAVLDTAAHAAAAGLGTTQDVAKVLGLTINAYGKENITAARAADILTVAVREGTAEADAFAGVLGRVIPTAASLGVSFDQVTAALAGMTLTGLSAEEAATSLNQVLISILKPTLEAEVALADMGTTSAELRRQLREEGLIATLRTLEDAFAGNEQAASLVFGNVRALRGALSLLGLDAEQLDAIFRDTAAASGDLASAFSDTEGPARDLDRATARIDAALISLSEDVLPVVVELAGDLANVIRDVSKWFKSLDPDTRKVIVQLVALLAVIGPVLFIAGSLATAIGSLVGGIGTLATVIFTKAIPALAAFEIKLGSTSVLLAPLIPLLALLAYEADNAAKYLDGTRTMQERTAQALENPLVPLWIQDLLGWTSKAEAGAESMAGTIDVALAEAMSDLSNFPGKVEDDLARIPPAFVDAGQAAEDYQQTQDAALDKAIADLVTHTTDALATLRGYRTEIEGAYQAAVDAQYDAEVTRNQIIILQAELVASDKALTKAKKEGTKAEIADATNRRIGILKELNALKLHAALIGTDMQKVTKLTALATSEDMHDGLTSKNGETKAAYEALQAAVLADLRRIESKGGPAAKAAAAAIKAMLDPNSPTSPLRNADTWGWRTGREWITNVSAAIGNGIYGTGGVYWSVQKVAQVLKATSPPGPESPLHEIDRWGDRTGRAWLDPFLAVVAGAAGRLRAPLDAVGTVLGASFAPPGLAVAAAAAGIGDNRAAAHNAAPGYGGGASVKHYHLTVQGDLVAKSPEDVLDTLRRMDSISDTDGDPDA